jgi:hypothetical protein
MYARNLDGGRALYAEGHVAQAMYAGGIVKALVYYSPGGGPTGNGIAPCFNSQTPWAPFPCGFLTTFPGPGIVRIKFPFDITGRFFIVTPTYASGGSGNSNNIGANWRFYSSTEVEVFTFETNSVNTTNASFMLAMF